MRYVRIDVGCWPKSSEYPWWMAFLSRVLPAANPDIEHHYESTHFFWVELTDDGTPTREIGFDKDGIAIVLAPVANNHGILIDAADHYPNETVESREAALAFENVWQDIWPRFEQI